MKILGIDPGLRFTGFGIIEIINVKAHYINSGVICTNTKDDLSLRIKTIFDGINQIISTHNPQVVSIEKVFVNNNPNSTLLLGQARGSAICACVSNNLEVHEYTALQVKQSVVGYGHATKDQISKMVKHYLNLATAPQKDAADGLAIALTHSNYSKICDTFKISSIRKGRLIR